MKYFIRWLLPISTIFTVLAAAILPKQLSQFQDQKLFHAVHAEEMSSNNSLPIWTPDIMQKLSLLKLWSYSPDNATVISRSLSDTESTPEERQAMEEIVYSELDSLIEAEILPITLFPQSYHLSGAQRFYIQDNQENNGNWFLSVELYQDIIYDHSNDWGAWMIIDEETGKMLWLALYSSTPLPDLSQETIGKAFLDRLDIEYEPPKKDGHYVTFPLKKNGLQYNILLEAENFNITIGDTFFNEKQNSAISYGW